MDCHWRQSKEETKTLSFLIIWVGSTFEWTNERTNERTDQRVNGWMDEWMKRRLHRHLLGAAFLSSSAVRLDFQSLVFYSFSLSHSLSHSHSHSHSRCIAVVKMGRTAEKTLGNNKSTRWAASLVPKSSFVSLRLLSFHLNRTWTWTWTSMHNTDSLICITIPTKLMTGREKKQTNKQTRHSRAS